jgi:hypothetical protein
MSIRRIREYFPCDKGVLPVNPVEGELRAARGASEEMPMYCKNRRAAQSALHRQRHVTPQSTVRKVHNR